MDKCFLCDEFFDEAKVKRHGEHIIQNAIAGKLISNDVLCELCGGRLSRSVDAEFVKELNKLAVTLNIVKDRKGDAAAPVFISQRIQIENNTNRLAFFLDPDFSVKPSRPIYFIDKERKEVNIFANSKSALDNFSKSSEMISLESKGFYIRKSLDFSGYINDVTININPESITILRGILKIAIEFAMHHSVRRSLVTHLIQDKDITSNAELLRSCVVQYYPVSREEKIYETFKPSHESNYPTHQIFLFNIKNNLYCYVEIFGVLQKYVHLTDSYCGKNLIKKYIQRATKYDFDESVFIARDLKSLDILAGENGVDISKYTGSEWWDRCQAEIINAVRKRKYELNPDDQIEKLSALMNGILDIEAMKLCGSYEKVKDFLPIKNIQSKQSEAESSLDYCLYGKVSCQANGKYTLLHTIGHVAYRYRKIKQKASNELERMSFLLSMSRRDYSGFRIHTNQKPCPKEVLNVALSQRVKYFNYKCLELLVFSQKNKGLKLNFLVSNSD